MNPILDRFGVRLRAFLEKPTRVLFFCFIFAVIHLVFQGGLFHIARLHGEHGTMQANLIGISEDIARIERKIRQAKDPVFIEQQAKDRLDMAAEDELVFVFASE